MDKILIAEDNLHFRTLIKVYMKKFENKFETIAVEDGLEAIEVLRKQPISLLVTDLQMPRVEGLVLLAYMNKNFPSIPCIVMTSLRRQRLKERLQKDVLHYIEKPFNADQLAQAIVEALDRSTLDGSIDGISITSFLQLIQLESKTCICEVESNGNPTGLFYFKDGVLYDASLGDLRGEMAALEMIRLDNATISFKKLPQKRIERRIENDLPALILDAMRIKDESEERKGAES